MSRDDAKIDASGDAASAFVPFSSRERVERYRGALPHWQQDRRTYFVTFRLADAMPAARLSEWSTQRAAWLKSHPEPRTDDEMREYHRLYSKPMHEWLDAGHGSCLLEQSECARLVEEAIRHSEGIDYDLGAFVIMPNHVHALVTPRKGRELSTILQAWKSVSAHRINRLLGRSGAIWQKESFDHIVRSEAQLRRIEQYIRDNPKATQRQGAV